MRRASLQRLVVLGVLLLGLQIGSGSTLLASPTGRASALTADERATLIQYAKDTWCSFQSMVLPSGLPADSLSREGASWSGPCMQTTPTDIAAYLWSVLAAERLDLIGAPEARSRLDRTLTTLEGMGRTNGFFLNDLDPRTGATLKLSPINSSGKTALPVFRGQRLAGRRLGHGRERPASCGPCGDCSNRWIFGSSTIPSRPPIPRAIRDGSHGLLGRRPFVLWPLRVDQHRGPIASYLGIARGQLPPRALLPNVPDLPSTWGRSINRPAGEPREYYGIKVFEGSYDYQGARIVPSWGRSMFEALMVTLFVP